VEAFDAGSAGLCVFWPAFGAGVGALSFCAGGAGGGLAFDGCAGAGVWALGVGAGVGLAGCGAGAGVCALGAGLAGGGLVVAGCGGDEFGGFDVSLSAAKAGRTTRLAETIAAESALIIAIP